MSSTRFDEDIWLLKRISLGANFELFLAFWPEENDKVLIKKVREDLDPQKKAEAEERLLKEAATLEEFWSPYFPKVYDIRRRESSENNEDTLYLIVQYFAGVSLREYLNLHMEKKTVSFYFIQNFILEMDHALSYLHEKKAIVHLDISPDNLIVTGDNKIKLIDFEDSRKVGVELDSSKLRGKELYLSPELFTLIQEQRSGTFEPKWDLYAYGKTIEELCQQTHGVDRLKCLSLRKKIRALKRNKGANSKVALLNIELPTFKLPNFKFKHLVTALASVAILALTILGLEVLGRAQSVKRKKPQSNLSPTHRVLKAKKVARNKPVFIKIKKRPNPNKVNRRPSLPKRPKAIVAQETPAKVINAKPVKVVSTKKFQEDFKKLISKKDPYLKECMSYESTSHGGKLSLSFHLRSTQGRAQKISFDRNAKLNQQTKSCLMALYADIVFPQHPSHKEVEIVQHFTFSQDSSLFL